MDDPSMTDDQITRAFEFILDMTPRAADLHVIRITGGDIDSVAAYIWDHWLGEPDVPTLERVKAMVEEAIRGVL